MEKISFILHGKIQGKRFIKHSLIEKFSTEFIVGFYETRHPRQAESLASQALKDGCDYLVAIGGDGTLHEMVNGYLREGGREKFNTRLGVLPYGTGNDFARGVGIRRNIDQLLGLVRRNEPKMLDAGSMEFHWKDGSPAIRYFDNISDMGIGAEVVSRVNGVHLSKRIMGGKLTFFLSILATFMTYKHKRIKVSWEGFSWEGPVLSLVVANGSYFGSGLGVAPDARLDDGLFEVVIFADLSIIDYLRNYSRVRKSLKVEHPEASYHRTSQLFVESVGNPVTLEADGEVAGQSPVVYTCLPGAMSFLIP
jgi:diacylglycerol kinase (ATP)